MIAEMSIGVRLLARPSRYFLSLEEQDVAGMDAFSLFTDPEGRMMGLWKQTKKQ